MQRYINCFVDSSGCLADRNHNVSGTEEDLCSRLVTPHRTDFFASGCSLFFSSYYTVSGGIDTS